MIPMLRNRSNGNCFDIAWVAQTVSLRPSSPPIMRERLVRIGHAVSIFSLLHRIAAIAGRVQYLVGQPIDHRLLTAPARVQNEPSNREAVPAALLIHLDGNLIS